MRGLTCGTRSAAGILAETPCHELPEVPGVDILCYEPKRPIQVIQHLRPPCLPDVGVVDSSAAG